MGTTPTDVAVQRLSAALARQHDQHVADMLRRTGARPDEVLRQTTNHGTTTYYVRGRPALRIHPVEMVREGTVWTATQQAEVLGDSNGAL